jgi:hypothetical protein
MRRRLLVPLLAVLTASALLVGVSATAAGAAKPAPCAGKTKKKAIKQIKKTYDVFLNGTAGLTLDERKVVVQGAEDPVLFQLFNEVFAANAEIAAITSTRVSKVTCTGKKAADTEFFLINTETGTDLLPTAQFGGAVIEDGIWKVTKETVCSLISIANPAVIESGPCAL